MGLHERKLLALRREAHPVDEMMRVALDMAKPGDCLLVAGKGHESYQEFADTVFPFDDRQVVRELIGIKTLKMQS